MAVSFGTVTGFLWQDKMYGDEQSGADGSDGQHLAKAVDSLVNPVAVDPKNPAPSTKELDQTFISLIVRAHIFLLTLESR